MRNSFRGFYPPTNNELDEMWDSGIIILDTNSLLNLFRYSQSTRSEFFDVLEKLKNRLWIPFQVGMEFHINRLETINKQKGAVAEIKSELEKAKNSFQDIINGYKEHSSLNTEKLLEIYSNSLAAVNLELSSQEEKQSGTTTADHAEKEIWERIVSLYNEKVGNPYLPDQLQTIYQEGEKRYEEKCPPGYMDHKKGHPRKFGDFVLWKQILDYVALNPRSVIFVTDDGKEDWWSINKGKTIGPRPELIDEFIKFSSGRIIHFYSPREFLRFGKERLSVKVSDNSLQEVQKVSTQEFTRKRVRDEREDLELRNYYLSQGILPTHDLNESELPIDLWKKYNDEVENLTRHRSEIDQSIMTERLRRMRIDQTAARHQSLGQEVNRSTNPSHRSRAENTIRRRLFELKNQRRNFFLHPNDMLHEERSELIYNLDSEIARLSETLDNLREIPDVDSDAE